MSKRRIEEGKESGLQGTEASEASTKTLLEMFMEQLQQFSIVTESATVTTKPLATWNAVDFHAFKVELTTASVTLDHVPVVSFR